MIEGGTVDKVERGSIAEEVGLVPGDRLLSINGESFKDIIDYQYLCAEEELEVRVSKENDEELIIEIEKDYDEDLGLIFTYPTIDPLKKCCNNCIFCFVRQMPGGMRSSLYVKDDDYRLSFLYGNFITLTNLSQEDILKIESQHLSPLYISVHTTEPYLREKMMNCKNIIDVFPVLERFAKARIEMHGQIVLCTDINDKQHLDKTIGDLASLWPSFKSVAVVPVGLTRYREGLYPLRTVTSHESRSILFQLEKWQEKFKEIMGTNFVFPADEFFLKAGIEIPLDSYYEEYPQTENGVGLIRLFLNNLDKWDKRDLPSSINPPRTVSLVTGKLAKPYLMEMCNYFKSVKGLRFKIWEIENIFMGREVTVSGLVCGKDIIDTLSEEQIGDVLLIPDVMVKDRRHIFLDDFNKEELEDILQVKIKVLNSLLEGVKPEDLFNL